jgi:hypothetical protein
MVALFLPDTCEHGTAGPCVWCATLEALDPTPNPYLDDPAGWVKATTGEHLWSMQVELMDAVRRYRRTAVPAAHGPGKSFSMGRLACWWIDVHPPGTAFVVTSAPTWQQVKAILWREIRRAHRKGNLPGRVLENAEWKVDGDLVAFGRKPADHDEDGFQGIHDRYVLVLLDEAGGIPKQLWTAAQALLTNEDARMVCVGNPDSTSTEFAAICDGADPIEGGTSKKGWHVIPIAALVTPNLTGEPVPDAIRPYLVSDQWCEELASDMGGADLVAAHRRLVDSLPPLRVTGLSPKAALAKALADLPDDVRATILAAPVYVAKVLGMFPDDDQTGVVPWSWVKRCQGADATARVGPLRVPRELGVDVGGSDSGDETVVYGRAGMQVQRRWSIRSADPDKVLAKVEAAITEFGPSRVKVDAIGIGWGLLAPLRRRFPDVEVVGVVVSEAASDPTRFVNKRAELWWDVARALSKDGAWDLSLVEEGTLAELAAPRWHEDKSGRIVIEAKADVRKRIGRSPDNADALILAFVDEAAEVEVAEERYEDHRLTRR